MTTLYDPDAMDAEILRNRRKGTMWARGTATEPSRNEPKHGSHLMMLKCPTRCDKCSAARAAHNATRRARRRKRIAEDPEFRERERLRQKALRDADPEAARERSRRYRNPERDRANSAEWRARHIEPFRNAPNRHKPWTDTDLAVALDRRHTAPEAAAILNRTVYGIHSIRRKYPRPTS